MPAKTDTARIYEMVLSAPGMSEEVKVVLKMSRKNILFLSKVIETGLSTEDKNEKVFPLEIIPKETIKELEALTNEMLQKTGLAEIHQKLYSF
jgi:hypothetical protein